MDDNEKRYNILIIDNDNDSRLNLVNILKSEFNISKAHIKEKGILFYEGSFTVIRNYEPNVIIINYNNFCKEELKIIRKEYNNMKIPIIIILKDINQINFKIFSEYGIVDFILNPSNLKELKHKIFCNLNYLEKYERNIIEEIKFKFTEYVVRNDNINKINKCNIKEKIICLCDRYKLTNREGDIVELFNGGLQNKEIADLLGISESTLKNHITKIYMKTGKSNKIEIIQLIHTDN